MDLEWIHLQPSEFAEKMQMLLAFLKDPVNAIF